MKLYKAYDKICEGKKIPRKMKKAVLGRRLNKAKLRRKLRKVHIIFNKYPKSATILPYPFCPRCGCKRSDSSGELCISDDYRDTWEQGYCLRCGFLVWEVDNSALHHCLEYPEWNYQLW